ncbi:MAG: substrate-binding domain-containing protein, partial [Phycisphaeraceae bacterium]|nr:substrate-binding domain-containing protein [Phycisphaeraceae bacterium]
SEADYTVAVIPKGTTHEFWKSVHAGANKAAAELKEAGTTVEVIWKGPIKEDERAAQIQVVETFITRGVDGIVLAPLDDQALVRPVKNATTAGIPVVIIDSGLAGDDYLSFVATDNYRGGHLAGDHLARLIGGSGKVVMLRYQEGSASTMKREEGFLAAMKERSEIEVISAGQYGGATVESAMQAAENLVPRLREADAVFCPNESTTFGMLRALEEAGMAGDIRFVGFDSSPRLVEALKNKTIDGLVVQDPLRMGYLGLKTLVYHLDGETVKDRVDTGVTLVTTENMNKSEIKKLLEPPLDKYLP